MPSLYDTSVPLFTKFLKNLSHFLEKGEKHADDNGIAHSKLLEDRMIDDMLPFTYQIQTACNVAKGMAQRVGGIPEKKVPDDETTFDQLQKRIEDTINILAQVDKAEMDESEDKEVVLVTGQGNELRFKGTEYVLYFVIPNFFFHVSTAYDLLRKNGVQLGKVDFLSGQTPLLKK